jgi:hypothetical protein
MIARRAVPLLRSDMTKIGGIGYKVEELIGEKRSKLSSRGADEDGQSDDCRVCP